MASLPWQYVAFMPCVVLAETAAVGRFVCHTIQVKRVEQRHLIGRALPPALLSLLLRLNPLHLIKTDSQPHTLMHLNADSSI